MAQKNMDDENYEDYGIEEMDDEDDTEYLVEYVNDESVVNETADESFYDPKGEEEKESAPSGGMAAMIARAANQRKDRLDKGGMQKVTHVDKGPNDGMDMVSMIAKTANARNKRIEDGGEVKVRQIPKEHKNVFLDIAMEAARVGTLTRLHEHTVEAVALKKVEVVWAGPSGLRTDHIRSNFFMAVNEAAAKGAMKNSKHHEVTNYNQNEYVEEKDLEDIDKMTDEDGRRVIRQTYLIDRQLEEERKWKKEEWSAENAAEVIRYNSMDEVELPSERPPDWKPKKVDQSRSALMEAISNGVAERAWERNYRLNRPKANLKVTRKCNCRFCVNPNPYQTHKYKEMHDRGITEATVPVLKSPEPKKKTAKQWKDHHVKQTRNIQPGAYAETSTFTPSPQMVLKYTPVNVPRKRIPEPPPKPVPEPEPEPILPEDDEYVQNGEPVVRILLDEATTWAHKREKTPKPKKEKSEKDKDKKKKKPKKESKPKKQDSCAIM